MISNETTDEYFNCQTFTVSGYDAKSVSLQALKSDKAVVVDKKMFVKHFSPYYAITVHRSQGQTINEPFTIYEYDILFTMGSRYAYTAISRSTSLSYINLVKSYKGEMRGVVYKYTNKRNGLVYIGSTFDFKRRIIEHKESTDECKFHVALRSEEFDLEVLCRPLVDSDEHLRQIEKRMIAKYNSVENGE